MNQALTFPTVEDLLTLKILILIYTLLISSFHFPANIYWAPSTCQAWWENREDALIRPILALEELFVQKVGQTEKQMITLQCVKAQKPLWDICSSRALKWHLQASLHPPPPTPRTRQTCRLGLLDFLFLESSRNRRIKNVAPVMRNNLVSMKEKQ